MSSMKAGEVEEGASSDEDEASDADDEEWKPPEKKARNRSR